MTEGTSGQLGRQADETPQTHPQISSKNSQRGVTRPTGRPSPSHTRENTNTNHCPKTTRRRIKLLVTSCSRHHTRHANTKGTRQCKEAARRLPHGKAQQSNRWKVSQANNTAAVQDESPCAAFHGIETCSSKHGGNVNHQRQTVRHTRPAYK